MSDLVRVEGLRKEFPVAAGWWGAGGTTVAAVEDVTFSVGRGETLGLVGESGCGKSTTARMILRLIPPTAGRCLFDGRDVFSLPAAEMRALRRRMQIVFQDPYGSLNPRHSVGTAIGEGLELRGVRAGTDRAGEVSRLLGLVGLPASAAGRFPHEFSGGQRQRVGIARALSVNPEFLVADEPVSALDVSVQAQILNLLLEVQSSLGLTCLFVAHDLAVVRHVSDRVAVMYRGRIVEMAGAEAIYREPAHPYTRALLASIPVADPARRGTRPPVAGDPSAALPAGGCAFRSRCPIAAARCAEERPDLREVAPGHVAACHYP